jgi:hypothetical protein
VGDIQKADPNARRAGLAIVGGGALLGFVLITIAGALRPAFEAWINQDVTVYLRIVIAMLTLLTTGPAVGMAGYLWRFGQRIVRAERYPPPGFRVMRDTPVQIGQAAVRRGRLVQALAAVIGVAGLLLGFLLWRLYLLLAAELA